MNDTIQRADVGRADVSLVHLDVGVPVDRQFDASEGFPEELLAPDYIREQLS